LPTTGISNATV